MANAARHVRAAVDGSDDGKQKAFDDLLSSSSAPGDPRKTEHEGVQSEVPVRPKPARDPLEERQATPPAGTTCEATPLAALAMPLNQAALAASVSKEKAADDEKSQPQGQSPDDPQIRTATTANATVPTGSTPKPGQLPVIEPHGPPVHLDDETPAAADPTKAVAPKIPDIRPQGSPVQPIENTAQQVKAADGTIDPVGSVEPHGPPSALPDGVPTPQSTGGMAKGGFTTTIPNPVIVRAETVPTSARFASEQEAASHPPATASGQDAATASAANPALHTVATQAPITTAAQLPASAGVTATPTDEEWSAETFPATGLPPANPASRAKPVRNKNNAVRAEKSAQDSKAEILSHFNISRGTPVAKRQAAVTTFPSTPETAERAALPKRDAAPFAAFGELRDKDHAEKPAAFLSAAVATTLHATGPLATTPTAETAAPASGIVEVDKVESLLQAVQQTAEKVRLDGHGQMELRVRLNGADDVTVQVRVDGDAQPQITFQTNSPELRQALERGWGDLAATSSKTSVSEARFAPAAAAASSPAHPPAPFLSEDSAAQPAGHRPAHRWSSWA